MKCNICDVEVKPEDIIVFSIADDTHASCYEAQEAARGNLYDPEA